MIRPLHATSPLTPVGALLLTSSLLLTGTLLLTNTLRAQPPPAPSPPAPSPPAPYPPAPYPPAPYPQAPGTAAPPAPYPTPPPAAPPSAGGLQAPPPIDANQAETGNPQEAELEQSEEDDSGRGLTWFWIEAEGGFQYVGLETFEVDQSKLTAGFVPTEASGGYVGAGLGVRLFFLTLGPRGRIGFFENWQLYSVGGELGFRFQLGILEPHFELGGGYAALGSLSNALGGVTGAADVTGAYGRIGGGLDFLIGSVFNLGLGASWEFMGLTRPGLALDAINAQPEAQSLDDAQKQALAAEGSGFGSAITISAKVGLHF